MFKFKKSLFAFAGVLALVGAVSLLAPRTGHGQPETVGPTKPVLVVNSQSQPVPVTGTVSVGNLGDAPLPVRDVDNPARQPVEALAFCSATGASGCSTAIFSVPEGKRLVIEYASARADIPAGQQPWFRIETAVGGTIRTHALAQPPPSVASPEAANGGRSESAHQVRIYADPGTEVEVAGRRNAGFGGTFVFTISGHLVDVP